MPLSRTSVELLYKYEKRIALRLDKLITILSYNENKFYKEIKILKQFRRELNINRNTYNLKKLDLDIDRIVDILKEQIKKEILEIKKENEKEKWPACKGFVNYELPSLIYIYKNLDKLRSPASRI